MDALLIEPQRQHECRVQMPKRDRVEHPATTQEAILGDIDDPIAIGHTRFLDPMSTH